MAFRLHDALATDDDDTAAPGLLRRYYGDPFGSLSYTGAVFDVWDSTGTRRRTRTGSPPTTSS